MKRPQPIKGFKKLIKKRGPAINEVIRETTAGGVVWRRNDKTNEIEILFIQDAKNRWTIPKGHIEPGENARQTAEREIMEETGLKEVKVMFSQISAGQPVSLFFFHSWTVPFF